METLGRWWACAVCALWLICAGVARAECIDAPDLGAYQTATPADFAAGQARSDRLGRVVAPVMVNGEGPFRFILDTGANRSVVAASLALRLGLAAEGTGEVHSVHGVSVAPLVPVHSLHYGELSLGAASMPILDSAVLAGEQGLLGVDGMRGRRLMMDFDRNCIEIVPAEGARRLRGWAAISGELRFGHLVVVRGSVGGVRVNLLVDTGSDSSLANEALRSALNARLRRNRRIDVTVAYTAGDRVVLENAIRINRMMMGDLEVRNITAYVGDFHIFHLWNLTDEPTLLIGMDVLTQARALAIDYQRGVVYLRIRDDLHFGSRALN